MKRSKQQLERELFRHKKWLESLKRGLRQAKGLSPEETDNMLDLMKMVKNSMEVIQQEIEKSDEERV